MSPITQLRIWIAVIIGSVILAGWVTLARLREPSDASVSTRALTD